MANVALGHTMKSIWYRNVNLKSGSVREYALMWATLASHVYRMRMGHIVHHGYMYCSAS